MSKPKCFRPICFSDAEWIPVIRFPTLRTDEQGQWVETDRPTFVMCREVCSRHRNDYVWQHTGFSRGDFEAMRDVAHSKGFRIDPPTMLLVEFKPLDWEPHWSYMELDRTIVYEEACKGICLCPCCGDRANWSPTRHEHACVDYVSCGIVFKSHTREYKA